MNQLSYLGTYCKGKSIEYPMLLQEKNTQVSKVFGEENIEVMNIQLEVGEEVLTHHVDANVLIVIKSGIVS